MKKEPELVDIFAIVAMYAYIRNPKHELQPDEIARFSYEVADEMIKWKEYND